MYQYVLKGGFNMKNLSMLSVGEKGKVKELLATDSLRRRFRDIGIMDGTTIKCTGISTHGDIASYLIKGAVIALRQKDAEKIIIE